MAKPLIFCMNVYMVKVKSRKSKQHIAVSKQLCHTATGNSHAIWDHTEGFSRQRWESRLYPSQSRYSI